MDERKEDTHRKQSSECIACLFLEKSPEIDLFGKSDAEQLVENCSRGQKGKASPRVGKEEREREEEDERGKKPRHTVSDGKSEAYLSLQKHRNSEKEKGDQILQKGKRKGMIYEYQRKKRGIRMECLFLSDMRPGLYLSLIVCVSESLEAAKASAAPRNQPPRSECSASHRSSSHRRRSRQAAPRT